MNHENTKIQRAHEDNFVLLSAFESLWFKFKLTHYRLMPLLLKECQRKNLRNKSRQVLFIEV